MPDVTEDAKYRVIELLADNPDMTQREMAGRLRFDAGQDALLAESACGGWFGKGRALLLSLIKRWVIGMS